MENIRARISTVEFLIGLAEESGELVQAALKLRRVFDKTNYTPVGEDEAIEHLYEEIADVQLYVDALNINMKYVDEIKKAKLERWKKRLGVESEG